MKKSKFVIVLLLLMCLVTVSFGTTAAAKTNIEITDWKAYNTSSATETNITEIENGIHVTGRVGIAQNESSLVILQGAPLNMNTVVSFDFSMNYDTENVTADRWFAILFNETTVVDGVADTNSMTLSTPGVFGNKVGMQLNFAGNANWVSNPRFGMDAFNNYTGYVSSKTRESEFWANLIAGKSVHIQVEKDTNAGKYTVTAQDLVFESPVNNIGDGRDYKNGQAYLGFLLYNSAKHTCNLDYKVENFVNGYISDTVIKHNGESVKEIKLNLAEQAELIAELIPSTSAEIPDKTVTWLSENPEVAEVSQNGTVTAKKGGNTVVRAVNSEGTYSEIEVIVPVESMSITNRPSVIGVGETVSLSAQAIPSDSFVRYRSLNPETASVDLAGAVTGIRSGNARIEVSCGQFIEVIDLEVRLDSAGVDELIKPTEKSNGMFSVGKPEASIGKTICICVGGVIAALGIVGIVLLFVLKPENGRKKL